MAEEADPSADLTPRRSWSAVATSTPVLIGAAGLASLLGFAAIVSMWMRSSPPDGIDRLRLAQEQYLSGEIIVAGKLAAQVEFQEPADPDDATTEESGESAPPPAADDADAPNENTSDQTGASASTDATTDPEKPWRALKAFLVGAGQIQRAQQAETRAERRVLMAEAVPILQDAARLGFPDGREAEGQRMLGEALLDLGRYQEAAQSLRVAINGDLTLREEWTPAIAAAELHGTGANPNQALRTIQQYLALPSLNQTQRRSGELIELEALLELRRWADVEPRIRQAMADINEADLASQTELANFRDQLRLLEARRLVDSTVQRFSVDPLATPDPSMSSVDIALAKRKRRIAMADAFAPALLELTRLHREAPPRLAAQAKLLAAKAYQAQGEVAQAISQLTSVRQQRPFGAEGIAAGISEIELLAAEGRGVEVLQTTRYILREIRTESEYDGALVPLPEFKRRLVTSLGLLRGKGDFESAIDTARSLPPLFTQGEALEQEAISYEDWAEKTLNEGRESGGNVNRETSRVARTRFRSAGEAYQNAAKLNFNSKNYLPLLWSAIDSFQKGRHFSRSIDLLQPYLRYEQRRLKPRGLIAYGRALLANGEPERAVDALETCIVEFKRDPLRYDARLMAALAALELHNKAIRENAKNNPIIDLDPLSVAREVATRDDAYLSQAKALLRENLEDLELRPNSRAWRDSLVTLGNLLYEQLAATELGADQLSPEDQLQLVRQSEPTLRDAIRVLQEVVERYWPSRDAESAAYFLARCHRLSAHWSMIKAQTPGILDAAKRAARQRGEDELVQALSGFAKLRRLYETYEEEHRLDVNEDTMLRNCLISEADTLMELKRFSEAETAYRAISLRYRDEPIALEAFLGQVECAKTLGQTRAAELLVQQALVVLDRIPPEVEDQFETMTRFDRREWGLYLNWMNRANKTAA